jgi:two-component sensor histidine kinase
MFKKFRTYTIGHQVNDLNNYHDKTRVNLLFNIASFVMLLGIMASIISVVISTYPILIPALGNVFLAVIALLIVKHFSFQLAAKIYFSALFILLFGNLIFNFGTMHIGSPFWVMLLIIMIYYILGKSWGITYIVLSSIGFSYYVAFVFPKTIEIVKSLPKATYYSTFYETVFVLAILGYVLSTIISASKKSDQLLNESNASLQSQNTTILESNQEKTILLKEIHHRVKNNLQVIVSLMRLQMHTLKNKESVSNYQETINRVLSMSMIHEKIYQTENLSQVNLEKYFYDLSIDLISSFEIDFKVDLEYNFEVEKIGLKTIVPLALIFNELFSNSLKHAFEGIDSPKIVISIKPLSKDTFSFIYEDNGKWKEVQNDISFGTELIESLTSQLDGEMKFENHPKTKYQFTCRQLDL